MPDGWRRRKEEQHTISSSVDMIINLPHVTSSWQTIWQGRYVLRHITSPASHGLMYIVSPSTWWLSHWNPDRRTLIYLTLTDNPHLLSAHSGPINTARLGLTGFNSDLIVDLNSYGQVFRGLTLHTRDGIQGPSTGCRAGWELPRCR